MKKTAILFPGQGSQYLGMGRRFLEDDPESVRLMELAEEVSGLPLARLCQDGPLEELTRVLHLQPAITVINMICWHRLVQALPDLVPEFVAGHSLGEYSALHAAGVLNEQDTLALVTRRGELMEREGAAHPGGMRAVLGLTIAEVEKLLEQCSGQGVVVVANHNSEKQVVISGDEAGLDALTELCTGAGARVIPLQVSVANHSPLVAGAVEDFAAFMAGISFAPPRIPLMFNLTAAPETDPDTIRTIMARQIASRVRWFESIDRMVTSGVEVFVEVGPKSVLTGLMKKILGRKSEVVCLQMDSPEGLEKVVQTVAA